MMLPAKSATDRIIRDLLERFCTSYERVFGLNVYFLTFAIARKGTHFLFCDKK